MCIHYPCPLLMDSDSKRSDKVAKFMVTIKMYFRTAVLYPQDNLWFAVWITFFPATRPYITRYFGLVGCHHVFCVSRCRDPLVQTLRYQKHMACNWNFVSLCHWTEDMRISGLVSPTLLPLSVDVLCQPRSEDASVDDIPDQASWSNTRNACTALAAWAFTVTTSKYYLISGIKATTLVCKVVVDQGHKLEEFPQLGLIGCLSF